jgi:phosphoribosylglycinamide formyltransferase-1
MIVLASSMGRTLPAGSGTCPSRPYTPADRTGEGPIRIAVLASGSGTNLQALLDADATDPGLGVQFSLALSDVPTARALVRAADAGVPTAVVRWADHPDRASFTRAVCDRVEASGAEAMVLAGFMRILGGEAIRRFPNRILNIHPALLPAFPGVRAVEQALEHGVKVTGVTVHLVDEQVDHGPIISQEAVPVFPEDDAEALHARLQEVEHRLYPAAVAAFAAGRLDVRGRTVIWR